MRQISLIVEDDIQPSIIAIKDDVVKLQAKSSVGNIEREMPGAVWQIQLTEKKSLKMPNEPVKPLLTWKEIAAYLKVSEKTAQRVFKIKRIPIFRTGRMVSTYPITLRRYLEDRAKPKVRKRIKEEGKSTREVLIELFQEYVKEIEKQG